jgi:uncharacterized damage-inducible protein DinB
MKLTEMLLGDLEREAARTRRVLENVPAGQDSFTPHERSMPFGRLAGLVASMPSWVSLIIDQDELDLTPAQGSGQYQPPAMDKLVSVHDDLVAKGRASLQGTNDEFLTTTNWRLKAGGQVVMNERRDIVLRDTLSHWAHHRGQVTVYLRLVGAKVPSVYGPSADDQRFL